MINYKDLGLNDEELDELLSQLKTRKEKERYQENINTIKEHEKYVGQCFYDMNKDKYIMVLSSKSSNSYRFECMCFQFPVKFYENHKFLTKIFNADSCYSSIEFEGFYVEDYPLLCNHGYKKQIDLLERITQEEYFEAMDKYTEALKKAIQDGIFNTSKNI